MTAKNAAHAFCAEIAGHMPGYTYTPDDGSVAPSGVIENGDGVRLQIWKFDGGDTVRITPLFPDGATAPGLNTVFDLSAQPEAIAYRLLRWDVPKLQKDRLAYLAEQAGFDARNAVFERLAAQFSDPYHRTERRNRTGLFALDGDGPFRVQAVWDNNRTELTLWGAPDELIEAVMTLVAQHANIPPHTV